MLVLRKNASNNKIIYLERIKGLLDEIKESYDNIHKYFLKYCIFPWDIYNNIIKTYNNIINRLKYENDSNIKIEYEKLSDKIFEFYEKIKKSSYNNDIFVRIKENSDKLLDFKEDIYKDIINNSNIGNITQQINIYDDEEKEYGKICLNLSF